MVAGSLTAYLDIAPTVTSRSIHRAPRWDRVPHTGHAVIIADELDVPFERVQRRHGRAGGSVPPQTAA